MTAEQILNALILENRGNWEKIYSFMQNHQYPSQEYLDHQAKNLIVVLDEDKYPEKLKMREKPSFGYYYEGDESLLRNNNILYIGDESYKNDIPIERILNKNNRNKVIVTNLNSFNDYDVIKAAIDNGNKIILSASDSIEGIKKYQPEISKLILDNGGVIVSEFPYELNGQEIEYGIKRSRTFAAALSNQIILLDSKTKDTNSAAIVNEGIALGKDVYVFPCKDLDAFNYELLKSGAPLITEARDLYNNSVQDNSNESYME